VAAFGMMIINGFSTFPRTLPPPQIDAFVKNGLHWKHQTPQVSLKRLYESMGVVTLSKFFKWLAGFKLCEIEDIGCPTLCHFSTSEGAMDVEEARQVYAILPDPQKAMVMFHVQSGADVQSVVSATT
jgi:hypothetical protein